LQGRALQVANRRVGKYPKKFRRMAVERLKTCDNIVELSQEFGVHRRLLYKWRNPFDPFYPGEESSPGNSRGSTLLALPSGSGRSAAGLRSASRPVRWQGIPPLALPRISPSCFPAAVSSTNRDATGTTSAFNRTPLHSSRSASVRKSACAISPMHFYFVFVAPSRNFATRRPSFARCGSRSAHVVSAVPRLSTGCRRRRLQLATGYTKSAGAGLAAAPCK
jgi:transposase-like protein